MTSRRSNLNAIVKYVQTYVLLKANRFTNKVNQTISHDLVLITVKV